jgi:hypothetical protein
VWQARTLTFLGLAILAGLAFTTLALGGAQASPAASHTLSRSSSSSSGCDAKYHPVFDCSIPTGQTVHLCTAADAVPFLSWGDCPKYTQDHGSFSAPDFNPVDWASWLSCQFVSVFTTDLPNLASAIWNAIQSYVGNFLVWILQQVFTFILTPIGAVENALSTAIVGAITWFGSVVSSAFTSLTSSAQPLGPFAPIVVVVATLGIFLIAGIGLYFVTIFLWAIFKTGFNLL